MSSDIKQFRQAEVVLTMLEKSFLTTTNGVHFSNGTANRNTLSLLTKSQKAIHEVIIMSQGS